MNKALQKLKNPELFDVKISEIYYKNEQDKLTAVSNRVGIINTDNDAVIGIVSPQYMPVSNREILSHFADIADDAKIKWEYAGGQILRDGAKTIMNIKFPHHMIDAKVGDEIGLYGYLINGFDGYQSAILEIGAMVLKCKNGMMIQDADTVMSYRHVGGVNEKLVDLFKTYMQKSLSRAQSFVHELEDIKFKNRNEVMKIVAENDILGKRYAEVLETEIDKQAQGLKTLTGWFLYNVYTYIITHALRGNIENKIKRYRALNRSIQGWR